MKVRFQFIFRVFFSVILLSLVCFSLRYESFYLKSTSSLVYCNHTINNNNNDNNNNNNRNPTENYIDTESPCENKIPVSYLSQRGNYWVFYNYIIPDLTFNCDESITYTTHSDFTFLDKLLSLLERWEGPVSLALYSPGTDFEETVERIIYLRECTVNSEQVKQYVSFHLFFDNKNIPKSIKNVNSHLKSIPRDSTSAEDASSSTTSTFNCTSFALRFATKIKSYRTDKKLVYPINVARNIARETAPTHFVLASDIELYPSPNLIPAFLEMILRYRNETGFPTTHNPKVFVLPIFELDASVKKLPNNKTELQGLLKTKKAIRFHSHVCWYCHQVPKQKEWEKYKMTSKLNVFTQSKRHKGLHLWEPIFIGTNLDPVFDERLSWEGQKDKVIQNYIMCLLDYEYHILDNAFLVHSPGIKKKSVSTANAALVKKQTSLIQKTVMPEINLLYGKRSGC